MSAQRSGNDDPHLVSLVVQSKKALQHGEQLCLRASQLSSTSARNAVDVLALDARVKWVSDAVLEQLKARKLKQVPSLCYQYRFRTHSSPPLWRSASNRNAHSCMSKPRFVPPSCYDICLCYSYANDVSNGTPFAQNAPTPSNQRSNPSVLSLCLTTFTLLPAVHPSLAARNRRPTRIRSSLQ